MPNYLQSSEKECGREKRLTDFSIDRLLKKESGGKLSAAFLHDNQQVKVGGESRVESVSVQTHCHSQFHPWDEKCPKQTLSWLNCTRFKPPKLQRCRKQGMIRKQHGRGPRIPFSPHQVAMLESTFSKSQYMSSDSIAQLAKILCISDTRVKIWFQNRRARLRRERDTAALRQEHSFALTMTKYHGESGPYISSNNGTTPHHA